MNVCILIMMSSLSLPVSLSPLLLMLYMTLHMVWYLRCITYVLLCIYMYQGIPIYYYFCTSSHLLYGILHMLHLSMQIVNLSMLGVPNAVFLCMCENVRESESSPWNTKMIDAKTIEIVVLRWKYQNPSDWIKKYTTELYLALKLKYHDTGIAHKRGVCRNTSK